MCDKSYPSESIRSIF